MKIKLKPQNQDEIGNTKTVIYKGKQNDRAKSQKSLSIDSSRAFGDDITKKLKNDKYNFIIPKLKDSIKLPSFVKQKQQVTPEIAPYQESIVSYIIKSDGNYEFTKKTKRNIIKSMFRVKVIEFFGLLTARFKLRKKTLFLASYYYDKYCQLKGKISTEIQSIFAQACLFIAMKYEEIYPPLLKQWCSNIPEVVAAQALVLEAINFNLAYTSAQHYLEIYLSKRPRESPEQKILYQCLLELYLFTGEIYSEHPLRIAQEVIDSFRSTHFMENETYFAENDRRVKMLISRNEAIWETILAHNRKYSVE